MQLFKYKPAVKLGISTLFGMTIFGLTACNSGTTSGTSSTDTSSTKSVQTNKNSKKPLGDSLYLMRMGSGIDSVTQTATSGQSCLVNASNQDNIYIGNPTAMVNFDHEQSMTSLQSALNVNVTGQYGGDRFGGSISAQFANSSKDTNYTTNLLYLYQYAGKAVFKDGSLGQGLDALTPYAAELEVDHPTDFRTMCGDEFVEQMDAGSVLAVKLALNFNSHSDQEQFMAQLNGDIGLANISAAIQQAASSSNVHVEMILSALQQGGQPEKLNELFGEPDDAGIYPFLQCETQDGEAGMNACNLMISDIIAYAQTMEDQLTNEDGSINLNNLYYTNPSFTKYANLGIPTNGAPDPSQEVLNAMEQMTSDYDKAVYDYNFASHYLDSLSDKLDSPTKENLRDAAQRLSNQINNVYLQPAYDVMDCYKGYVSEQCVSIYNNVEHALIPYELSSQELNLISYLETNSYEANIINYYGDDTPSSTDYKVTGYACTFAPVSSPNAANYAIYCDGKWLETYLPTGVTILPGFAGTSLGITSLSYISTPPNSTTNGQLITYADSDLPLDAYYDNYFYGNLIEVMAPGYSTHNATLGFTRLYENQA